MTSKRKSFVDIVADVKREAAAALPVQPPVGFTIEGDIVSPDGRRFAGDLAVDIDESRAAEVVAEPGTIVVYDPCGCGGYCGLDWFHGEQVDRLRAAGLPAVRGRRKHGSWRMTEWRSDDGVALLLIDGRVSWGGLLGEA